MQIETVFYNVHNILNIRVTGKQSLISEVDSHLSLFRCSANNIFQDLIIEEFEKPGLSPDLVFDEYNFHGEKLWRNETKFLMSAAELPHVYKLDKLTLPINLMVQLALLKKGYTFIHAAGVRFKEKSSILCAYPGVGKTTLISVFNDLYGEIYGDDLVIVGNGKVLSYPQSFTIYPYHVRLFKKLNQSFIFKLSLAKFLKSSVEKASIFGLFGKVLGLVRSRYFPDYVTVSMQKLLNQSKFLMEDKLDEMVMLERANVNDFKIITKNKAGFIEQANAILWHEWHSYFHELLLYDSLMEEKKWLFNNMQLSKSIMDASQLSSKAKKLLIPHNWNSEVLAEKIKQKLRDSGNLKLKNLSDRFKG